MDLGFRNRVAEAVHRALGKITRSDGFSKCRQYLLAGVGLLSLLADRYCVPQAGPILIAAGEPDRWVGIDINVSRDSLVALADGYHRWIADATDCSVGCDAASTVIDLSSRHYHRMLALRQGKAGATKTDAFIRQLTQLEQMRSPLWTDCGLLPTWTALRHMGRFCAKRSGSIGASSRARSSACRVERSEGPERFSVNLGSSVAE